MSKFECRCGNVMKLVSWSEHHEMVLISENSVENISNIIENIEYDKFEKLMYDDSIRVINCPNCVRIWLANKPGSNYTDFISYIPES